MTSLPRIEINPNPLVRVEQITEEFACVVIDDFLRNPGTIIDYCCEHADKFSIPERSYPGPLLSVSDDAMSDITRFIRSTMGKQFSFLKGGMTTSTFLSMVTLQPERLSNLQRLCHTDPRQRADRHNFAGLVYLFTDERLGGTGFYRWKERLKEGVPSEMIAEKEARDRAESAEGTAFVPISLKASPIEIQLPNGGVVRLPLSVGQAVLVEVIRAAGALRPWKEPQL